MHGMPTGTYLIRKAESAPGNFSLSVRDGESVKHYRIRKMDNGGYFITSRAPFPTLHELVKHYEQEADGLVCKLSIPCANDKPLTGGLAKDACKNFRLWRMENRFHLRLQFPSFIDLSSVS